MSLVLSLENPSAKFFDFKTWISIVCNGSKHIFDLNPISTERGQIWPEWPDPVWHFHILMVRVAKLHDFVSFYICQVPERLFFEKRKSIFEKSKKMISHFQHQRVPPLDKNQKSQNFSLFLKNNHTFLPKHELEMFSAFFWCIYFIFC